jgi:glyoxylase-like metal-dependent hydrolase (beta-lactamase superfamily II)
MPSTYGPPRRVDLGGCTLTLIDGGRLRLDGGAMFGIIPRPLWSRTTPADDQHRIQLACNCLLVEFQHETARRVIIETGHGDKYTAKEQSQFNIDPRRWLLHGLHQAGVDPVGISDVILSHLHFDHAGGLTRRETEDAPPAPTFPAARVHVQRREFDDARANFGIMTITYREENYTPIDAAGAWNLLDGDEVIIPAPRRGLPLIRALPTPGHTRGHQSIVIQGRDRTAVFAGDVMPTAAHLGAPYNMSYDLFPLDNRASKQSLLSAAAEQAWLVIIDHEPTTPLVSVVADRNWFTLRPAE